MKSFLLKTLAFLLTVPIFVHALSWGVLQFTPYHKVLPGAVIYEALLKSKRKTDKAEVVLIGDSVCGQLFPAKSKAYSDSLYSLASNQAISAAGQYLLLNQFAKKNDLEGKTVHLLYTPSSFRNDLRQIYTFHYFLKPFFTPANRPLLDDTVMHRVQQVPFYYTSQWPVVKTSAWTPYNGLVAPPPSEEVVGSAFVFSEVSMRYLVKLNELAKAEGFTLKLHSPPLRESVRQVDVGPFLEAARRYNLEGLMKDYLDRRVYMPDDMYRDDVHFKGPYVKQARQKMLTLLAQS